MHCNGETVLEIPTWNTRSVVWTRSGMVHIDLIKLSIGIASNLFQFPGHFIVKREKNMRKNNSPGIQVLSKTNIQFTYNPYYTTICRKAQPYLAPRIVMLLSLQVQVWQRLPIAILSGKLVCRQGRGEANKGGRGEEREKQGEGEARRDRRGRKEEGDAGGKVRVRQEDRFQWIK